MIALPGDAGERLAGKFPRGIRCLSWRPLEKRESLMPATSFLEYEVVCAVDDFFRAAMESLGKGISFEKETKQGKKMMEFQGVVASYEASGDRTFSLRLHAGTPDSLRADRVVMASAGVTMERMHEFRIVKVRQLRSDGSEIL